MPWGRIDDHHYRHPKVGELDDGLRKGCLALYWLAISWCNDHLTDGRVPPGIVRTLGGDRNEADELVRVGLWECDGTGYRVHDYLEFNKSREQVIAERAQRIEAGKLGAAARWSGASSSDSPSGSPSTSPSEAPSEPTGEMHGGSDAPVTRIPSPVTPSQPAADTPRAWLPNITEEAGIFLEGVTGRTLRQAGERNLVEYDRQIGDHGLARTISAYQRTAKTLPLSPKPTARQLVWSARSLLEPFADTKAVAQTSREEAAELDARKRQQRIDAETDQRRREHYRMTGEWPFPGSPPEEAA